MHMSVAVVSDTETGAVIGSALVTVGGTGIETPIDTWTDDDGTFVFSSLPAGPVSVRVEAAGYPIIVEDMELDADATHLLYIHLPTVYAILEELLVVGKGSWQGRRPDRCGPPRAGDPRVRRKPRCPWIERESDLFPAVEFLRPVQPRTRDLRGRRPLGWWSS